MFQKLWVLIWAILFDQVGEGEGEGDGGEGSGAEGSEGEGGAEGEEGAAGGGSGVLVEAEPAFGEFGEEPKTPEESLALAKKIYEAHKGLKPNYDNLTKKAGLTERNLAQTRAALEKAGIRLVDDGEGNMIPELIEKKKDERKFRFNDEVVKRLAVHFQGDTESAKKFVDDLRLAMQDEAETYYETRDKTSQEKNQQLQAVIKERKYLQGRMDTMFPQVNPKYDANGKSTNPQFNQALFDRATEIWKEQYRSHPLKELYATMDAAEELGISAQVISKAKAEGFKLGKDGKKILGPVGGGNKGGAGRGSNLTREEYFKLTPEERLAYDKKQAGL